MKQRHKCEKCLSFDVSYIGDDQILCENCYIEFVSQSALNAGIPFSVVQGKTKLTDHFSQDYIDFKRNKKKYS